MPPPRFSRRDFLPPLLPIQKERHPPFLKPAPCVELLEKGAQVKYTPRGEKEAKQATILAVHGDCFPPYYTIALAGDGKQRQVEASRLRQAKR